MRVRQGGEGRPSMKPRIMAADLVCTASLYLHAPTDAVEPDPRLVHVRCRPIVNEQEMKRRLCQWGLVTGIVCVSSLLATILFEQTAVQVAEALLGPWFAICRAVTPTSWQTRGNALLGMMWLIAGIVVYSMLIGAACVIGLSVADKLRRPDKERKAAR